MAGLVTLVGGNESGGSKDPLVVSTSPMRGPGCQSRERDLGMFTRVPALGLPGHLPSGVNPSSLGIARERHFGAEGEEIAVSWAPSSRPKPFTHRGLPWLCSTRGGARRPGYTPAAERMPQPLAAGEAAGKGSCCCCCCWVAQLCMTLCNPMECSTPGFPVHGISHPWVGCHFLLQGILPTQQLNPGIPHCRKILYPWAT